MMFTIYPFLAHVMSGSALSCEYVSIYVLCWARCLSAGLKLASSYCREFPDVVPTVEESKDYPRLRRHVLLGAETPFASDLWCQVHMSHGFVKIFNSCPYISHNTFIALKIKAETQSLAQLTYQVSYGRCQSVCRLHELSSISWSFHECRQRD